MPGTYERVLLKLSGEALKGPQPYGIHLPTLQNVACQVKEVQEDFGVQIGIVLGGGNIFRGVAGSTAGMDRASADYMGMLATVMNGLALCDALEKLGATARVQSAIEMPEIAEYYVRRRAIRHLEKGRIVIFAGGTGNPYFTTDTAAALRGAEIGAQAILKATKVDGVYDRDPARDANAVFYPTLTYQRVLEERLRVMDATAVSLCRENDLPIVVFNLGVEGNIRRVIAGERVGTTVSNDPSAGRETSHE